MKKSIFACLITGYLISSVLSCGSNGCEESRESFCSVEMKATSNARITQLYVWGVGQGGQTTLSSETIRVNVDGEMRDSIVFDTIQVDSLMVSLTSSPSLSFILNPDTTVTTLRMQVTMVKDQVEQQVEDTITLTYEPYPYLINMECGCSVFFDLHDLSTSNHFIQDATIKNNVITNEETTHIIITY